MGLATLVILLYGGATIYFIGKALLNGDVKEASSVSSEGGKNLLFMGAAGVIIPIMYSVLGVFRLVLSVVLALIVHSKYLSF